MRELALHILDLLQNALEAGATHITLTITEDTATDRMTICVEDDGRGMPPDLAARALDPFVTTRETRHVGLGLPLLAAAAERTGGGVQIESNVGRGTTVTATLGLHHWDRAPLGDMPGTVLAVLLSGRPVDLIYTHSVGSRTFCFDTAAVRRELGEVPLTHPRVRSWLQEYLTEGIASLQRPVD